MNIILAKHSLRRGKQIIAMRQVVEGDASGNIPGDGRARVQFLEIDLPHRWPVRARAERSCDEVELHGLSPSGARHATGCRCRVPVMGNSVQSSVPSAAGWRSVSSSSACSACGSIFSATPASKPPLSLVQRIQLATQSVADE